MEGGMEEGRCVEGGVEGGMEGGADMGGGNSTGGDAQAGRAGRFSRETGFRRGHEGSMKGGGGGRREAAGENGGRDWTHRRGESAGKRRKRLLAA
jgi:hypothetical protein